MAPVGRNPYISLVRPGFLAVLAASSTAVQKSIFWVLTSGSVATYNPDHWRGALRSGEAARL